MTVTNLMDPQRILRVRDGEINKVLDSFGNENFDKSSYLLLLANNDSVGAVSREVTMTAGNDDATVIDVGHRIIQKGNGNLANGVSGVATGVSLQVEGTGNFLTLVFTLTNFPISLSNVGGAVEFGGAKIFDFPAMAFIHMSSVANFTATRVGTNLSATFNPTFACGSAITADNALAGTEVDFIAATAAGAAVAGVATFKKTSSAAQLAQFGGTTSPSSAVDYNINVTVPDADIGGLDSLLLNGTIRVSIVRQGVL